MTQITLDRQIIEQTCSHCQKRFSLCRGSVYDEGEPIAIYLAALHCCQPGKLVHLVISISKGYNSLEEPTAISLTVIPADTEYQVRIIEPRDSPWESESYYLGHLLGKEEARCSPLKDAFFHFSDHIIEEILEITRYLESAS